MITRFFELAALGLGGWALARLLGLVDGATIIGPLVGIGCWVIWDGVRATKVTTWLQSRRYNQPPKLYGVWGDVVERSRKAFRRLQRRAQDRQRRLEEFLSAIQASPNGVILLDELGRIEWSNQAASDHLGLDPRRDVRQYIRNLVRSPAFAAYVAKGDFSESVLIEGPNAAPDALSEISMQMHAYGDGRHLLLSNDVTALKRAESMRRDFVANVSHEIRTPLTVIRGFVETLQSLQLSEVEQRHYLELMGQQAARMDSLVVDLLTLSRLEGSPLPTVGEWLEAGQLCTQVVSDARALSAVMGEGEQNILVETVSGYRIAGLRSELLSAMGNLLSNAVRYTPVGGDIRAGWRSLPDGGIAFVVQDTGGGIAPEHLPRLTERFYRVDRSRSRETGGTGLGLAIVKHVAQRHGGELRIESTLGKGSEFAIHLPARRVKKIPA